MFVFGKKKGFTLIEILLVIALVAILSTLAVSGYLQYRKAALLSLSVDSMVSQINEFKSKAVYGTFEDEIPKCFGFYFDETIEGSVTFKAFSQIFDTRKVWNGDNFIDGGFVAAKCGEFNRSLSDSFEDLDSQLDPSIKMISVSKNDLEINFRDLVLRFSPPNGELDISLDSGLTFEHPGSADFLEMVVQYGAEDNDEYRKIIKFDLNSEKMEILPFIQVTQTL